MAGPSATLGPVEPEPAITGKTGVYPNPATNELTVSTDGSAYTGYTVTDMAGREMLRGNLQSSSTTINVAMLAAGAYLLRVSGNSGSGKETLFVKN